MIFQHYAEVFFFFFNTYKLAFLRIIEEKCILESTLLLLLFCCCCFVIIIIIVKFIHIYFTSEYIIYFVLDLCSTIALHWSILLILQHFLFCFVHCVFSLKRCILNFWLWLSKISWPFIYCNPKEMYIDFYVEILYT